MAASQSLELNCSSAPCCVFVALPEHFCGPAAQREGSRQPPPGIWSGEAAIDCFSFSLGAFRHFLRQQKHQFVVQLRREPVFRSKTASRSLGSVPVVDHLVTWLVGWLVVMRIKDNECTIICRGQPAGDTNGWDRQLCWRVSVLCFRQGEQVRSVESHTHHTHQLPLSVVGQLNLHNDTLVLRTARVHGFRVKVSIDHGRRCRQERT